MPARDAKKKTTENKKKPKKKKKLQPDDVEEALFGDTLKDEELSKDPEARSYLVKALLHEDDDDDDDDENGQNENGQNEDDAYANTEKRWLDIPGEPGEGRVYRVNTKPTIENYVCTFNLGLKTPINRKRLATRLLSAGTQFNPRKFASITIKLRKNRLSPSGVGLIFSTTKIVLTGTKCLEAAALVAHRIAYLVRTRGRYARSRMLDLRVRNIVGCLRMGTELDLVALCSVLRGAAYDPENFPGLIYRDPLTNIRFLVYSSGKIVITGAKNEEDIDRGAQYIAPECAKVIRGSKSAQRIAELGDYGIHDH